MFIAIALSILGCSEHLQAVREEWKFSSLEGHGYRVRFTDGGGLDVSVNDVTLVSNACDGVESFVVCSSNRYLPLVIPREEPSISESWTYGGRRHQLLTVVDAVDLLGLDLSDILVIDSVADDSRGQASGRGPQFRFFFSYSDGLIAFVEIHDQSAAATYLVNRLPSIGAATAPSGSR